LIGFRSVDDASLVEIFVALGLEMGEDVWVRFVFQIPRVRVHLRLRVRGVECLIRRKRIVAVGGAVLPILLF
jgi:hypothetical protein